MSKLHEAAKTGDVRRVQAALTGGWFSKRIDVNARSEGGRTALHEASASGHEAVVEVLLAKGADVRATTDNGMTALHIAAAGDALGSRENPGHLAIVKLLVDKGADVNGEAGGLTPLLLATLRGHAAVAEYLTLREAGFDRQDKGGGLRAVESIRARPVPHTDTKPFFNAIRDGKMVDVQRLLEENPGLANATDEFGGTALSLAALQLDKAVVELLIGRQAEVNLADSLGTTALHNAALAAAAVTGNTECLEILVSKGANVNARDRYGDTPLDVVLKGPGKNKQPVVEWLKCHGTTSQPETTPSREAELDEPKVERARDQAIHTLADLMSFLPPTADKVSSTPFHRAAATGDTKLVERLLAEGMGVDCVDENGLTALHLATAYRQNAVVQLLLAKGANVRIQWNDTIDSIGIAAMRADPSVMNLLLGAAEATSRDA